MKAKVRCLSLSFRMRAVESVRRLTTNCVCVLFVVFLISIIAVAIIIVLIFYYYFFVFLWNLIAL